MSLAEKLVIGRQSLPPRICIYGTHGVGKSTLASQFPKPIFISTEDGIDQLEVVSFPKAAKIGDVVEAIKMLLTEDHEFRTVVLDSVDWLVTPLIEKDIEGSYDAKELAYGKGQIYVAEAFREILQGLDALRRRKGMNIVLIAHAAITRFDDPRSDGYDRFGPKLPNRCNALLQEWVDVLAFAAFKVIIKKSDTGFNNTKARGVTTGERLLHFVESPAYLAKNRYALQDDIEMTFANLSSVIPLAQ